MYYCIKTNNPIYGRVTVADHYLSVSEAKRAIRIYEKTFGACIVVPMN